MFGYEPSAVNEAALNRIEEAARQAGLHDEDPRTILEVVRLARLERDLGLVAGDLLERAVSLVAPTVGGPANARRFLRLQRQELAGETLLDRLLLAREAGLAQIAGLIARGASHGPPDRPFVGLQKAVEEGRLSTGPSAEPRRRRRLPPEWEPDDDTDED